MPGSNFIAMAVSTEEQPGTEVQAKAKAEPQESTVSPDMEVEAPSTTVVVREASTEAKIESTKGLPAARLSPFAGCLQVCKTTEVEI